MAIARAARDTAAITKYRFCITTSFVWCLAQTTKKPSRLLSLREGQKKHFKFSPDTTRPNPEKSRVLCCRQQVFFGDCYPSRDPPRRSWGNLAS